LAYLIISTSRQQDPRHPTEGCEKYGDYDCDSAHSTIRQRFAGEVSFARKVEGESYPAHFPQENEKILLPIYAAGGDGSLNVTVDIWMPSDVPAAKSAVPDAFKRPVPPERIRAKSGRNECALEVGEEPVVIGRDKDQLTALPGKGRA
jgi:hypothetical protein